MGRTAKGTEPKGTPRSELARALGAVLRRRFDEKMVRGSKTEFGRLLGEGLTDASASVKASKLLAGQLPWPEHEWAVIAAFVGLTPEGLLREVAAEIGRVDGLG